MSFNINRRLSKIKPTFLTSFVNRRFASNVNFDEDCPRKDSLIETDELY